MHAEIIFEPGSKSVLQFDDEKELKDFLIEHVRRAKNGDAGGPGGHPAERVTEVQVYNDHPADLNPDGVVSADSLTTLIEGMADKDGNVSANQLTQALRDEVSPVYPTDQGKHRSIYKMDGKKFDLFFLDEDDAE